MNMKQVMKVFLGLMAMVLWVSGATGAEKETHKDVEHEACEGHDHEEAKGVVHEWAGAFDLKPGLYRWHLAKKGGKYADPTMKIVALAQAGDEAIKQATPQAATLLASDAGTIVDHGGTLVAGKLCVMRFDTTRETTVFEFRPATAGRYVFYAEHVPYEFEVSEHFFKDADGKDVEPVAEETVGGHGHAHGEAGHAEHGAEEGSFLDLPPSAHKLLGMTFATATNRPVAGTARFPGRFEWRPDAARVYGAALEGKVEIKVSPAQRVKPGDLLFSLVSPEWIKQGGELRDAEASVELARVESATLRLRVEQLREAGTRHAELEMTLAQKEAAVVKAQRTFESAKESRQALAKLFREKEGELLFEATEEGLVESFLTVSGSWVEKGASVLRIVKPKCTWFHAEGLMAELSQVQAPLKGFMEPLQGGGLSVNVRVAGRVEVGLVADTTRRVQSLYFLPEQHEPWMAPGRAGVLSVVVEEAAAHAIALPLGCVVSDGLRSVVFVQDASNGTRFHRREVVLGVSDGDWVEVKGVEAGAVVVLTGAYELKLATPSAAGSNKKAAGHFHADGVFHEAKH
jgi:cobalt-zinc-cadmium efflux system membrane fusion protein